MNLKYKIKIKSLHKESIKLYTNFLDKILKRIKVDFSMINLPKKKNRITHILKRRKSRYFNIFILNI